MFKSTEMDFTSEKIIENLDVLAKAYSIRTVSFLHALGLPFELVELDNENPANRAQAFKRLCEIDSLLNTVRPWFTTDRECWYWFRSKQLEAFSNLTPSEIVSHYQGRGISALYEWVEERKIGNFQ